MNSRKMTCRESAATNSCWRIECGHPTSAMAWLTRFTAPGGPALTAAQLAISVTANS